MGRPKKTVEEDAEAPDFFETFREERHRVLSDLGLMSEEDLALIYGCGVRALKNRPKNELPPFFRAGGKRVFFRADVIEYFQRQKLG